jgi:hypothetical protein
MASCIASAESLRALISLYDNGQVGGASKGNNSNPAFNRADSGEQILASRFWPL